MKYRKKPLVIDAIRWTGLNCDEVEEFMGFTLSPTGDCPDNNPHYAFRIHTLEGEMKAMVGDYIIKGIKGEFYPCKPDIFEKSYDEVTEREKK